MPSRSLLLLAAGLLTAAPPVRADGAGGFTPDEAVRRITVADGLEVSLVASEPQVRQPIAIRFDARGRMWVIQYLQYPKPAGLKPLHVDAYARVVYDRVPEPPPRGPKGADRITILEDPDGAGRMTRGRDFVSGLNLASGVALGYDGVFVMQPPYLLFYADRNHDDVPDGPPEVLLSGFGLQDTRALANSLQWGPDGWLYGAQGSTVTSRVNGVEFNQGIWRYNVRTRVFELFADGGGNTWGLDFDAHGNAIAGTNYDRGVALHQVQGGIYVKNLDVAATPRNPYAFGALGYMPVKAFKGGHITIGGLVYQGGALPERFNGAYIAGNLLANAVYWHVFHRDGSSFTMELGDGGGDFLTAHDAWFRPVDCLAGPDGAVYIADWYDKRANHADPRDNWDKTNGRIYQVRARGAAPAAAFDLRRLSSAELVARLRDPNEWFVRMARQLLAERRDASVYPALRKNISADPGKLALESLWALYGSGGWDDGVARLALDHANEDVRAWAVRLLGDARTVPSALAERLARLARTDPSPVVRSQLACTARRLPGPEALPIIRALLHRDGDVADPQIPLLLWWAIEDKAISDRAGVLALLASPSDWRAPMVRDHILTRLARRYAAEENDANFATCARLLSLAPGPDEVNLLIQGMEQAFAGRALPEVPPPLRLAIDRLWHQGNPGPALVGFAARLGSRPALARARTMIADQTIAAGDRIALLVLLGQIADPASATPILRLLEAGESDDIREAALAALQSYSDPAIARRIVALYPAMDSRLRLRARMLLEGRAAWARELLRAVDGNQIDRNDIPLSEVRKLARFAGGDIAQSILKNWGKVTGEDTGEKLAEVRRLVGVLTQGQGDVARGRKVFQATCAVCHAFYGAGGHIGPDLGTVDRFNTQFMLENIVSPSLSIRPEYISYNVELRDGRTLTGFIADSNRQTVTLRDISDQRTVLARDRIKSLTASPVSLMPEGLLEAMTATQVRDLFAFLQSDKPN